MVFRGNNFEIIHVYFPICSNFVTRKHQSGKMHVYFTRLSQLFNVIGKKNTICLFFSTP